MDHHQVFMVILDLFQNDFNNLKRLILPIFEAKRIFTENMIFKNIQKLELEVDLEDANSEGFEMNPIKSEVSPVKEEEYAEEDEPADEATPISARDSFNLAK